MTSNNDKSKNDNSNTRLVEKRVDTGGGAYVGGNVDTGGGTFVGRDQIQTVGTSFDDVVNAFETIYSRISDHPNLNQVEKDDLNEDVQAIQKEIVKTDNIDESFLNRRFRNIKRMAPDILDIILTTLANPTIGLSSIAMKIADKAKKSTNDILG